MSDNNAPTYYVMKPGGGNVVAPSPLDAWRGRSKKQEEQMESYLQTVATIKTVVREPSPCPCKSKECEEEFLKDKQVYEETKKAK
jgi:hypothetical protein